MVDDDVVGVAVELVLELEVVVLEVVLAPGFLSDGTQSSRRWISVTWSGPNWFWIDLTTVPNGVADLTL